jgi:hypothetical protein
MATRNKPPKKGRPIELTPEVQAQVCAAISLGAYMEAAASFAGIHKATLYRWINLGAQGKEPYASFCDAMEQARSKKVLRYLKPIEEACTRKVDPDWKAAAWVLERTEPEHYGTQERLEVEHHGGSAVLVLPAKLTPEEYEAQWLKDHPDKIQ